MSNSSNLCFRSYLDNRSGSFAASLQLVSGRPEGREREADQRAEHSAEDSEHGKVVGCRRRSYGPSAMHHTWLRISHVYVCLLSWLCLFLLEYTHALRSTSRSMTTPLWRIVPLLLLLIWHASTFPCFLLFLQFCLMMLCSSHVSYPHVYPNNPNGIHLVTIYMLCGFRVGFESHSACLVCSTCIIFIK
jgi:hypothetical protein